MNMKVTVIAFSMGISVGGQAIAEEVTDATNILPEAKPGQCYAKVIIPPKYEKRTDKVLVREAAEKITPKPAEYAWTEERILVQEPTTELIPVQAEFKDMVERVETRPGRTIWVNSLSKRGIPVSPGLVAAAKAGGANTDEAIPGMCFREYYVPAKYAEEKKDVLVTEASEMLEVVPAEYAWEEKKVMVKEATVKIVEQPAVYETVTEKVLVEPEQTVWKKGRGLVEKIDNLTGELLCLVTIPAKYKTIEKQVVKTPASFKKVEVPAEYKTIKIRKQVTPPQEKRTDVPAEFQSVTLKKMVSDDTFVWQGVHDPKKPVGKWTGQQICLKEIPPEYVELTKHVVKTPARFEKKQIPAVYETVKIGKVITKADVVRTKIPAEYKTVETRVKVHGKRLEWRQVLCETNMTKEIIAAVQEALQKAGYDPGSVDGILGAATLAAVENFQRANDLPRGGLTIRTLEALGVEQ